VLKNLFFYAVMFALTLLLLEGLAFATVMLIDRDDFFDHRQSVLARLTEDDLQRFRESTGDPVIGWDNRGPDLRRENNCLGEPISYRYDQRGARIHDVDQGERSEVIIVGDSYTHGDEAQGDETYPAVLAKISGRTVANHGVGGHGPVQAFLNLQQKAPLYPQALIAVLAIMNENLYRMVNSYRPVLYDGSSEYTLKPFMRDGEIVPHPGEPALADLEVFMDEARSSFDEDFWAKPGARFPYLVSVARGLTSNYFRYRKVQKAMRKLGSPEYSLLFQDPEIAANLVSLLNRFTEWSLEAGLMPVAMFIPRNPMDVSSASGFLEQHGGHLHPELSIGDVAAMPGVDWERFNLVDPGRGDTCHPSGYGYRVIAEYLAGLLEAA
jgi:hypothetical protein